MRTRYIWRLIGSAGVLALAVWGEASEPTPVSLRLSDELERAIYLHEGEADLEKAEEAYRGILEESELVDSIAAETNYRLALIYLDQGKQAMAMKLLSDLVNNYPSEELWVAEAEALLPQEFVPEITPWQDGERTFYDWVLPTGDVVGHSFSTIYSYEWEGRELWRKETRFVLNGHRSTAVEYDKDKFYSVYGRMNLEAMGTCRAWYAADGLSVKAEYSKTGKSKEFNFSDRVYDNEQVVDLLRQIPVELGYRMTKKIFVSFSGMPIDIGFEVVRIEQMDTALGKIECYEVEIDMQVQKQSVVFTADESRVPVVFKVGGVEAVLTKLEVVDVDADQVYRNGEHEFALTVPGSWSVVENSRSSDASDQVLWLAEPMVRGIYMAASELNSDWKREEPISLDGLFEEVSKKVLRQFRGIDKEATLLKELKVSGMQGKGYVFEAPQESELMGDVFVYVFLGAEKHYVFQGVIPESDVGEMLPVFEGIVTSLETGF